MKREPIRPSICAQANNMMFSFTFAHGLTFPIRLPIIDGLVEIPHIRRLIVHETILFLLLTITTCRQTRLVCLHHSSGLPVESQSGLFALFECQFECVATALCALMFDLVSRLLIEMMRIIDLSRCQMAFLFCRYNQTSTMKCNLLRCINMIVEYHTKSLS